MKQQFHRRHCTMFILILNKNNEITIAGNKLVDPIIHKIGYASGDTKKFITQFKVEEKINLTNEQYERYIDWLRKKWMKEQRLLSEKATATIIIKQQHS